MKEILKKEILEHLITPKILISLLIVVLISITGGYLSSKKHIRRIKEYNRVITNNENKLKNIHYLDSLIYLRQIVVKKPKQIEVFVNGAEEKLLNSFSLDFFRIYFANEALKRKTKFLKDFLPIDLIFTVVYIISLLVIIITYDSISKEKEQRTLSMLCSYSINRSSILLAKYLSRMIIITLILLIGFLSYFIVVYSFGIIEIRIETITKLVLIFILSLFFSSVFLLISILISSLTHSSSTSITLLILIWIILVVVIPSLAKLIGIEMKPIPTIEEKSKEIKTIYTQTFLAAPKELKEYIDNPFDPRVTKRNDFIRDIRYNQNLLFDKFINDMISQGIFISIISRISFVSIYRFSVESIANVGFYDFKYFWKKVKKYHELLKDFIIKIDKKDKNSPHLPYACFDYPTVSTQKIDSSGIPRFYKIGLQRSFRKESLIDIGILIFLNIVLFQFTYYLFIRYDVR